MQSALEMDLDSIYYPEGPSRQSTAEPDCVVSSLGVLEMPRRPAWSFSEARGSLEERERTHIHQWLDAILSRYPARASRLFRAQPRDVAAALAGDRNVRLLVLLIADVRHPVLL